MSIIQEALKKVQGSSDIPADSLKILPVAKDSDAIEKASAPNHSKSIFGGPLLLLIIFLTLIFFGIKHFSNITGHNHSGRIYESILNPVSNTGPASTEQAQGSAIAENVETPHPNFVLSGIVQLMDGPRAIINGVTLAIGDTVSGAVVQRIGKDTVVLKEKDSEITLGMK